MWQHYSSCQFVFLYLSRRRSKCAHQSILFFSYIDRCLSSFIELSLSQSFAIRLLHSYSQMLHFTERAHRLPFSKCCYKTFDSFAVRFVCTLFVCLFLEFSVCLSRLCVHFASLHLDASTFSDADTAFRRRWGDLRLNWSSQKRENEATPTLSSST